MAFSEDLVALLRKTATVKALRSIVTTAGYKGKLEPLAMATVLQRVPYPVLSYLYDSCVPEAKWQLLLPLYSVQVQRWLQFFSASQFTIVDYNELDNKSLDFRLQWLEAAT